MQRQPALKSEARVNNMILGYQIQLRRVNGRRRDLSIGLAFKLVLAPFAILLLYAGLFGARGEMAQITVFEAAMPPQIGAAIVAIDHDLDPELVTLMVGVGISISFVTLPLWRQMLTAIA